MPATSGSLRGTANNLAAAVGTAVVGALLVGLLSAAILRGIAENPLLPPEIQSQIDLDSINFVSNDRLLGIMQRTTATPEQVSEAVRVNTDARLSALRMGLLLMAGLALLAIIPAGRCLATGPAKSRSIHRRFRNVPGSLHPRGSPGPWGTGRQSA